MSTLHMSKMRWDKFLVSAFLSPPDSFICVSSQYITCTCGKIPNALYSSLNFILLECQALFKKLLKSNFDLNESKIIPSQYSLKKTSAISKFWSLSYMIETIQGCLVSHQLSLTRHWGEALVIRKNIFLTEWHYFAAFALQVLWKKKKKKEVLNAFKIWLETEFKMLRSWWI